MKAKAFLTFSLLFVVLGALPQISRAEHRADGMRFLPDVIGQFEALTENPEALGFHIGGSPDPSSCRHYQGMVRVDGPDGTPYFLVTRSGNLPKDVPFPGLACNDSDGETGHGQLIVFRMGSRDKNGERLRSNRLSKQDVVDQTQPPASDVASIYYTVTEDGLVFQDGEGGEPPRMFQHPGGMQVVGHMLAMAVETPCQSLLNPFPCEPASSLSMVLFFDVSDPEHPVMTSKFPTEDEVGAACGVVGITPLPGGRNLMVLTGGDNEQLFFYHSNLDDLSSRDLSWNLMGSLPGPALADAHQTLQFLRQGDINGPLYLAGARGSPISDDRDRINLYEVICDPSDCGPGARIDGLTQVVAGKRISPFPTMSPSLFGEKLVNLAAASTFYVSPSSELLFYATEHDNDGPGRTVKAGEWRHADVVRGDSPTLLPHAVLNNPYEVNEGEIATLTGGAEPPVTRAFLQLFKATNLADLCPVIDFDDHELDEFDNLGRYCFFGDDDGFRSASWYAPESCAITMTHTLLGGFKTLDGTGSIVHDLDLSAVLNDAGTNDMDKRVNKVDFANCDSYYETPVALEWDLDRNGTFETTASQVTFDASALDGPAEVSLPVQARHPDTTLPGPAVATVLVRNVAPDLTTFSLTDGAGSSVPSQVPFVLTGLPVTLRASFLDPGLPDHQTALVSWGDGSSDNQSAFTAFDEAFGDGSGNAAASHAYAATGGFDIAFSLTDDDGGADAGSAHVDVVTMEQAVDTAVTLIDNLIAGSTGEIRKALEKAAKALYAKSPPASGAREMIGIDNDDAAIALLNVAIGWLQEASSLGADTATLVAILQQIVVALGAGL